MDVDSFDLLSSAILLLNQKGFIAHANTAAEELFGYSRRQLTGMAASMLFGADEALARRLPDAIDGQFGILRQDMVLDQRGRHEAISLTLVPLVQQPWAALIEARAIEHHILLDRHQQLGNELAVQRESLRNLAHEVKNPLGGIRGAAQLLDAELGDLSEQREYTQVIIAEVDRLATLVDRLISPQGGALQNARFNIHEVCERVYRLVITEFPDIKCVRDYDASVPELTGDFARLLQALLNIARNAAQVLVESSSSQAGQLTLRTRVGRQLLMNGRQVRMGIVVSVTDNGPGVPADLHDKVFHPLVTGRANGTGLGLSLAQEFVLQHGGALEFDSRPGNTTFRMLLPLENA